MAGLIVELILSWLLLWIFCKQSLLALGIAPTTSRLFNLLFGFLIAAGCCTVYYFSFTLFANHIWSVNHEFTGNQLIKSSWWTLNSVLYEELIFRGALLYILIKKLGVKAACILSAIGFGIYHWFTSGAMGNPWQMIFIFLMTGIWGVMFAVAFAKTRSLYLPVGLHFGWNFVNIVIFSQGPLGKQFLIGNGTEKLGGVLSVIVFLFQLFAVPLLMYWYVTVISKREKSSLDKEQNKVSGDIVLMEQAE
jgi:membrane protease YdiL (CAAX protease family)